jgi:hypothetical protein
MRGSPCSERALCDSNKAVLPSALLIARRQGEALSLSADKKVTDFNQGRPDDTTTRPPRVGRREHGAQLLLPAS